MAELIYFVIRLLPMRKSHKLMWGFALYGATPKIRQHYMRRLLNDFRNSVVWFVIKSFLWAAVSVLFTVLWFGANVFVRTWELNGTVAAARETLEFFKWVLEGIVSLF